MARPSGKWSQREPVEPPLRATQDSFARSWLVLHRGFVTAAQDDIEPVAKAVFRDGRFPVEQGDQPFSRCLASDTVEYWIKRQERVAREIHLSDQAGSKGRPENREMDMCWTPGIVMVAPRVFARTNGFESKAPFRVSNKRRAASEIRVERGIMLIAGVKVTTGGIGLPDLHKGPSNGPTILVQNLSADQDAFPEGFPVRAFGQINRLDLFRRGELETGEFGNGLRQVDRQLAWRSFNGGDVGGAKIRWQNTVLKISIKQASSGRIEGIGIHKKLPGRVVRLSHQCAVIELYFPIPIVKRTVTELIQRKKSLGRRLELRGVLPHDFCGAPSGAFRCAGRPAGHGY